MTRRFPSKRPLSYLITEGNLTDDNFSSTYHLTINKIKAAASNGVELVQIREKSLCARNLVHICKEARAVSGRSLLLINDRFDIALAADLDGVHLTELSLPVSVVRQIVLERLMIGCSRHSLDGAKEAKASGADFAVVGPIFPTAGKGKPMGLEGLKRICSVIVDFPVLGLGGINGENMKSVLESGAAGIAAIRFLNDEAALAKLTRG